MPKRGHVSAASADANFAALAQETAKLEERLMTGRTHATAVPTNRAIANRGARKALYQAEWALRALTTLGEYVPLVFPESAAVLARRRRDWGRVLGAGPGGLVDRYLGEASALAAALGLEGPRGLAAIVDGHLLHRATGRFDLLPIVSGGMHLAEPVRFELKVRGEVHTRWIEPRELRAMGGGDSHRGSREDRADRQVLELFNSALPRGAARGLRGPGAREAIAANRQRAGFGMPPGGGRPPTDPRLGAKLMALVALGATRSEAIEATGLTNMDEASVTRRISAFRASLQSA